MSVLGLSGKDGTAKKDGSELTIDVTAWQFDPTIGTPKYASNLTSGHKVAVAAVADFTGNVTTKLAKPGAMPFRIGDSATLELHVDDSGSNYVSVPALIASHPIPCDINDGEVVEVVYGFEPTGAPTYYGILRTASEAASSSSGA